MKGFSEIANSLQGGFGTAISSIGVLVIIWSIVLIGKGFMTSSREEKLKGILLFAAGALMAGIKSVAGLLF